MYAHWLGEFVCDRCDQIADPAVLVAAGVYCEACSARCAAENAATEIAKKQGYSIISSGTTLKKKKYTPCTGL